jgi:soluble lytic murein transglycosylase-like protein
MLPFVKAIDAACVEHGYSQLKTVTQIAAESGFDPSATSPTGAIGLCQIEPATAAAWGVDPTDPVASINALVVNMAAYVAQFGSFSLALAAYNAGPGAVQEYGGIPHYAETEEYVAEITATVADAVDVWPDYWKQLLEMAP